MSKITCVKHGSTIAKENFYLCPDNSLYDGIGRIPICKNCLYDIVEDYFKKYKKPDLALYYTCRVMDVAFFGDAFESVFKPGMSMKAVLQGYMRYINSLGVENGQRLPFDHGEHIGFSQKVDKKDDKKEVKIQEPVLHMTDEDLDIKRQVIDLVGYDPFYGYSESDQKALYQDLIGYLDDEDIIEDNYLLSVVIDIVTTNLQVKKINFAIGQYMADPESLIDRQSEINSLVRSKKDLAYTVNNMAKENNITVKSRGGGAGKSSLTLMTERLREMGFEKAEEDYYNQLRAKGWQRVADISFAAMSEQIQFDENDVADIIEDQRQMVRQAEESLDHIKEVYRELQAYKDKLEKLLKEAGVEFEQEHHTIREEEKGV